MFGLAELTSQQILDLLHVDLHIADFDCILDGHVGGHDRGEDLLDYTRNETFEVGVLDVCTLLHQLSAALRPL
jgi:hypothetical protein